MRIHTYGLQRFAYYYPSFPHSNLKFRAPVYVRRFLLELSQFYVIGVVCTFPGQRKQKEVSTVTYSFPFKEADTGVTRCHLYDLKIITSSCSDGSRPVLYLLIPPVCWCNVFTCSHPRNPCTACGGFECGPCDAFWWSFTMSCMDKQPMRTWKQKSKIQIFYELLWAKLARPIGIFPILCACSIRANVTETFLCSVVFFWLNLVD